MYSDSYRTSIGRHSLRLLLVGAGLIDERHAAISPIILGSGEHLLGGIDTLALGYQRTEQATTAKVMHFILTKRE